MKLKACVFLPWLLLDKEASEYALMIIALSFAAICYPELQEKESVRYVGCSRSKVFQNLDQSKNHMELRSAVRLETG